MRVVPLMLAFTLTATGAWAQGFGLDLSEEGPVVDLSGPDLRPTVAVVGSQWAGAQAPARFDTTLAEAVERTQRFSKVLAAGQVKEALGGDDAEARACHEEECARTIAARLNVDLLILSQASGANGQGLSLALFLRDTRDFERLDYGNAVHKRELSRGAGDQLAGLLAGVSPLRALLKLTVSEEAASVKLGERDLGQGNLEVAIPPVPEVLRASAPGFVTGEEELAPVSGETIEVSLTLQQAAPVVRRERRQELPDVQKAPAETPLYERPGFFLILGGVAAIALGFGMGASAKSVEGRAVDDDGDGTLDITRAEAMGAQRSAILSNVFVLTGLAMAGGGAAWLAVTPTAGPAKTASGEAGWQGGLVVSGGF